jgi:hypothetical protein
LELWLNDPCTQALVQCFEWYVQDIRDELNSGSYQDPSNNDLTCNNLSRAHGRMDAFKLATQATDIFHRYDLMEEKKDAA